MTTRAEPSFIADSQFVKQLERALEKECQLYSRYLTLVQAERAVVSTIVPEKITALTQEREVLSEKMSLQRDERLALCQKFPNAAKVTLTSLVERYCTPGDRQRLIPLVARLRALIGQCRKASEEFDRVVNYSLNMVSGCISIIWSANQSVNTAYTAHGKINQSYVPREGVANTLKEA